MKVLLADGLDVHWNLALEDVLLDRAAEWGPVLYFCRNAHAVVIGKNQNPWRECRLGDLFDSGGRLGRRVSGGGAVYHDEGNLNFGLVVRREEYEADLPYGLVIRALRALGIFAERLGRTSLGVDGRKVSGNAFCFRRNAALHHGTLLIHSDLGRMQRLLTPDGGGFETHAIRSEAASVMNLAECAEGIGAERVRDAILAECREHFGGGEETVSLGELGADAVAAAEARHRSWEWQFGHTPTFVYGPPGGPRVRVVSGRIADIDSDTSAPSVGCRFEGKHSI